MTEFFKSWLSAWTGNQPSHLCTFYSDDAFYSDPHLKDGISGKPALLGYFEKLLSKNPDWEWKYLEHAGNEGKYYLKWECHIPIGGEVFTTQGLDLVWLENDKIIRNEVYFDTYQLKMMLNQAFNSK